VEKFMLIVPWSGADAITRSPIGIFRCLSEALEMVTKTI
jgi:hypothetical protein